MTSFHEIRFPASISCKAEGRPAFKTEISSLKNGYEKRNILWSSCRAEYKIKYKEISKSETNQIISFFMARKGRSYGFRFKDWNDFEARNQTIGIGDNQKTNFQLIKEYGDDENKYKRTIHKVVDDSIYVYINGVEQQSGFTIDNNSGVISFSSPPELNAEITANFEFDIPVRFDEDLLMAKSHSFSTSSIDNIKLVELKI